MTTLYWIMHATDYFLKKIHNSWDTTFNTDLKSKLWSPVKQNEFLFIQMLTFSGM